MHPDTRVAQFGTGLERYGDRQRSNYRSVDLYTSYPYGDYRTNHDFFLFLPTTYSPDLSRIQSKEIVLGLCREGRTKAYPFQQMPDGAVINDLVGETPVVILFDAESRTALPYLSQVGEQVLSFYAVEPEGNLPVEFMDAETGSRWNMLGQAVAGPLAGQRLEQVPAYNSMWFAWNAYWPDTRIWAGEGILDEPPPTAVEEEGATTVPGRFFLEQNFPNPFNPTTQIRYALPVAGPVRLNIYTPLGQRVRTLVDRVQEQGLYQQTWDGLDEAGNAVASGTYLYRLEMPQQLFTQVRAMTLVR